MRMINFAGRLALLTPDGVVDVERASGGLFAPDPQAVYPRWDEFRAWAAAAPVDDVRPFDADLLGPPVPRPGQVFAIGLNYRAHAQEAGLELPEAPMVFTKFPASITGPGGTISLPPGAVDFEAELVAVIGRRSYRVDEADGWSFVAGLTAGQDLSERHLQLQPPAPQQYNLGKSYPGFAPIGPALVTPDEFVDPDDLELGCTVSGEQMQKARTRDLIFSVPQIVAYLSSVLPLLPGDVIFTGTPSGIGWAREPKRLLSPDDELVTRIEGIGEMRHRFAGGPETE
jgi:2-keto-4-pentenoate hydratase/2-oxohepta-3-ene-1,7-dioic acid hydratase in catechol pathway